jgi:tryptophanyl-tRNA synthetase
MTSLRDAAVRGGYTFNVALDYLAAGVDPEGSLIFRQSDVPEVCELSWLLSTVTPMGMLERAHAYKDKIAKGQPANHGLFAYPVLMAADILVYKATHVPVGEDQKQHLELSRDIAQKFNNDFAASIAAHGHGEAFFPLPEPMITGPATRVMSLRDGTRKMSKSEPSEYSRIDMNDDADTIAQKFRKARTDAEPLPSEPGGLKERPEAENLVGIYAALAGVTKADVLKQFGGAQFSAFKPALSDLAVAKLAPISAEMTRLKADPAYIDGVLADGAARAEAIARPVMDAVKDIVGLLRTR